MLYSHSMNSLEHTHTLASKEPKKKKTEEKKRETQAYMNPTTNIYLINIQI